MEEIIQNVLNHLQMDFWFTVLLVLLIAYNKWWGLFILTVKVIWNWDCEVLAVLAFVALLIDDARKKPLQFYISPQTPDVDTKKIKNIDIPIDDMHDK